MKPRRIAHFTTACVFWVVAHADANWDWTWRNPFPQGNFLRAAVRSQGRWVVVGDYGTALTSTDGVAWTPQRSGFAGRLLGICAWPQGFVAVGDSGRVLLTSDGVSWSQVKIESLDNSNNLRALAWNGKRLVAVGGIGDVSFLDAPGAIVTSMDGTHWSVRPNAPKNYLKDVAASGDAFVAVGLGGAVARSSDGETWTSQKLVPSNSLLTVNWNGDRFLAAGSDGIAWTSPDGSAWTRQTTGHDLEIVSIAWTGSEYFASGYQTLLRSLDGKAWTSITQDRHRPFLTHGDGLFLGLSDWHIETSTDGKSWFPRTAGHGAGLNSVVRTGKRWLALGGEEPVLASAGGITWTVHPTGHKANLYAADWSGTGSVAVGVSGVILRSTDGLSWEAGSLGLPFDLVEVKWLDSMHVTVGYSELLGGGIHYSKDGKTWNGAQLGLFNPQSVAWTGKRWIVSGSGAGGVRVFIHLEPKRS